MLNFFLLIVYREKNIKKLPGGPYPGPGLGGSESNAGLSPPDGLPN